jgi:hypothetical protein
VFASSGHISDPRYVRLNESKIFWIVNHVLMNQKFVGKVNDALITTLRS